MVEYFVAFGVILFLAVIILNNLIYGLKNKPYKKIADLAKEKVKNAKLKEAEYAKEKILPLILKKIDEAADKGWSEIAISSYDDNYIYIQYITPYLQSAGFRVRMQVYQDHYVISWF